MTVGAAGEPHEILSASNLCAVGIRRDRQQTGCDQGCTTHDQYLRNKAEP
jgi:hypothetical protein